MPSSRGMPRIKRLRSFGKPSTQERELEFASNFSKGMISSIDPADLPNEAQTEVRNGRFKYDTLRRRGAYLLYDDAAAPDVNRVHGVVDGLALDSRYIARITKDAVHVLKVGVWLPLAGSWSMASQELLDFTTITDRSDDRGFTVLANGTTTLKEIFPAAGASGFNIKDLTTGDGLVNAPAARYVVGFADRLVAASVGSTLAGMSRILWSSQFDIRSFDPVDPDPDDPDVDISSDLTPGSGVLRTTSTDTKDGITGLFPFAQILIILRERSIWQGTRTQIAENPIHFTEIIPRVGCDVPQSAQVSEFGTIFLSISSQQIYVYVPGQRPQPIGDRVINEVLDNYKQAKSTFSAYDYKEARYYLGIESFDGTFRIWIYNFELSTWEFDTFTNASSLDALKANVPGTGKSIDQLDAEDAPTGSTIDELTGPEIDDVGFVDQILRDEVSLILMGTKDGNVLSESLEEVTFQAGEEPDDDFGPSSYELIVESKEFRFPREDTLIAEIRILYTALRLGSFTLEYSKNGGADWLAAKTHSFEETSIKTQFSWKALKRGRRIMWRVRSATGILVLHEYEIYTFSSGDSRDGAYPGSRT